jgi:catechol 2,3-dioxygenase-like lactoylglutathione lyase family enzyme
MLRAMGTATKRLVAGVAGISVVYFYVRDLDRAVDFFRDLLGIPLEWSDSNWAEATLGGTRFALHAWHEGAPEPGSAGVQVSFLVDDVDATAARLSEAGVDVGPVQREPYGAHCRVAGPEGYAFSLFHPAQ